MWGFWVRSFVGKTRSKFTKTFQRVINTHSKPTCIILLVNYPNNNDNDSLTLEMLKRGQNAQILPKIVIFSFLCKYIVKKLRIFSLYINGLYPNIFFGLFRSKNTVGDFLVPNSPNSAAELPVKCTVTLKWFTKKFCMSQCCILELPQSVLKLNYGRLISF